MAAKFIQLTDFKGFYVIHKQSSMDTLLNSVLEDAEKNYLVRALGRELYGLLIADLDSGGDPQTDRFKALVNGENYTDYNDSKEIWNGLNDMLKPLCYLDLKKELLGDSTVSGFVEAEHENARNISRTEQMHYIFERYNKGVEKYRGDFHNYMFSKRDDFPEWEFVSIATKSVITEM